jgi:hypothetical protein
MCRRKRCSEREARRRDQLLPAHSELRNDNCSLCPGVARPLYGALEGQGIENPAGWLVVVTFRRAIEERRGGLRIHRGGVHPRQRSSAGRDGATPETETASVAENDLAEQLDDRMRLRQLFEALNGRLDGREREAATLCYLQGLSRAEAAARMDVSEARMRKLMEGRGPGRPGVARKVGTLVSTIREDGWCEQQASLMRAFAYGILDPAGERHRLALLHIRQCPACRAYVGSLRGLAAVLPPAFVPLGLGAGILARAGGGGHTPRARALRRGPTAPLLLAPPALPALPAPVGRRAEAGSSVPVRWEASSPSVVCLRSASARAVSSSGAAITPGERPLLRRRPGCGVRG